MIMLIERYSQSAMLINIGFLRLDYSQMFPEVLIVIWLQQQVVSPQARCVSPDLSLL
jgi:hypothetical protein